MRVRGRVQRWNVIAVVAAVAVFLTLSGCRNELVDAETYTLSYDANGATSGMPPEAQMKAPGGNLTVASNSGNLQRIGYRFDAWNTATDDSGGVFVVGATYSTDADLTLYAMWTPLQVGDTGPAGGIVFYDKGEYSDGWRYLEAAPAETEWTNKTWGGLGTVVGFDAQGMAIGTGAPNTLAIVAEYGDQEPSANSDDYAARLTVGLVLGNYDDWFLPSLRELNEMYDNLRAQGIGDFGSVLYWSSSEGTANGAWAQDFNDGFDTFSDKSSEYRVRAARAF